MTEDRILAVLDKRIRKLEAENSRLCSEGALKDVVIEAAQKWRKAIGSDGEAGCEGALCDALSALVSEGQRDIGQEILDGIKEMKRD